MHAPFTLRVRVQAEVTDTLLYGCGPWTLGREHSADLRTAHRKVLLQIIGFHRRQRSDHHIHVVRRGSQAGTNARVLRLLSANYASSLRGPYSEQPINIGLTCRGRLGTKAGGESPRPDRPKTTVGFMSSRRPQGYSCHQWNPEKKVILWCWEQRRWYSQGRLKTKWEVVSGGHRPGSLFHGEVVQGRGKRKLPTPRSWRPQ